MDVQIKTFRLQNAGDEQSLNDFLNGKIIRHWATSWTPADVAGTDGTWHVIVAYEIRMAEARQGARNEQSAQRRSPNANDGGRNARNAPKQDKPREKPAREEYVPQVEEKDKPLFEAVRKWRNARAREENVKPFELFNNHTLEEIIKGKPTGAAELRALVPEMSAQLWDRYHNELLGFIGAAVETAG